MNSMPFEAGAFKPVCAALPGNRAAIALTFLIRCHEEGGMPAGVLLQQLRQNLKHPADAALKAARTALIDPVASFLDDIIAPAFRTDTMPLLFLAQNDPAAASVLELTWPQSLTYRAEGSDAAVPGLDALVPPLRLSCCDSFALFGSGHLAYSLVLGTAVESGRAMSEIDLLLLQKFADMTEGVSAGSGGDMIPLMDVNCFSLDGGAPETLLGCVQRRLGMLNQGSAGAALRRLFDAAGIKADSWSPEKWTGEAICGGFVHIDGVTLPVDSDGEAGAVLAGLCQNILDFGQQDASEMADSLKPIFDTSEQLEVFAHSRLLHEFSLHSRSFSKMAGVLGACPYLMLTHLVLVYDERLLSEAEVLLNELVYGRAAARPAGNASLRVQPLQPLFVLLEKAGWSASQPFADSLRARLNVFRELEFPYINNIFRYQTEQGIFAAADAMRGLSSRHKRFRDVLEQYENAVRDIHDYGDVTSQRRIGLILFGLSLLSLLGFIKDVQQIFQLPDTWWQHELLVWSLRAVSVATFLLFLGIVCRGLWLIFQRRKRDRVRRR